MFALHFDNYGGSSIEFGGYTADKISTGSQMVFLDAPYSDKWEVEISAIRVGDSNYFDNGSKSAFYFHGQRAFLDSFSPTIKLPKSIQVEIYAKFFHGF